MEGDPHEVHASSRCFCSFSIIISAFILVVYILALNKACRYFIKMTAFYLTILINAIMCCFACMPIYFFGDVSKFIFNAFYYFSYWTRISCDLRHGEYFKSDSPFIVVCNHQSSLDVVMLSNIWPSKCTIMMKRSLLWMPFFNYACLLANVIFVDRTNHKKAVQSLQECGDRIKKKNLSVWVFPEGTRNHDGGLLEFKKGAFNIAVQAGIPVVPCVISSYRPFYNKDDRYFADTGYVIVEVLKPISTKNMTLEDVPKLAEDVRSQMMETYERISKEAAEEYYKRTGFSRSRRRTSFIWLLNDFSKDDMFFCSSFAHKLVFGKILRASHIVHILSSRRILKVQIQFFVLFDVFSSFWNFASKISVAIIEEGRYSLLYSCMFPTFNQEAFREIKKHLRTFVLR